MRMPFVEGLNSQVAQTKQKIYSKVHSEPLLPNNPTGKEEPKKRRVLHTVVQADGSVVGFCTEESDEETGNDKPSGDTNKPNESQAKK